MYLYTSRSSESPKLNNAWGDFNKVINYVLDGGALQSVKSIESIGNNKCKISFETSIPFVQFQTIDISGATNTLYNTRLFIESIDIGSLSLTCYSKTLTDIIAKEETANIKAKVIACGMQKLFGGVAEERTIFKTTNGICYRIDDRDFRPLVNPPATINSTSNNWQKVARVCMAENFDSLDSSSSRLFPYSNLRPTENFTPTGKYIGQAFISYNRGYISTSANTDYITLNNMGSYPRTPMEYNIYANEKCIYIYLYVKATSYDYYSSASYAFGEYENFNSNAKSGLFVSNSFQTSNDVYDTTSKHCSLSSDSSENLNPIFPYTTYNNSLASTGVIYDNLKGIHAPIVFRKEVGLGGTYSGRDGIDYPNEYNNGIYISDYFVISSSGSSVYGKLIDIKYIANSVVFNSLDNSETIKNGSLLVIENNYYIAQKIANSRNNGNYDTNASLVLIKLDR